jgi:hypothetical protein
MEEFDYALLLDDESDLDSPSSAVIEFCDVGLKKLGKYDDYEWLFKKIAGKTKTAITHCVKPPEKEYSKIHTGELRQMLLDGELFHEYMSQPIYERLLDNETYEDPNSPVVVAFCSEGLRKLEKYAGLEDLEIYMRFMDERKSREQIENDVMDTFYIGRKKGTVATVVLAPFAFVSLLVRKPKYVIASLPELFGFFYRKHKRVAVAGIAISLALVFTLTVSAMGFNVIDLGRRILNLPERTPTDIGDNEIIRTDTFRFYDSIDELLEFENLSILFPSSYEFNNFEITDFGAEVEVLATTLEPYIRFVVRIGFNNSIEHYDYEVNGIRYYVIERDDGLYQAGWTHNSDYYMVVIADSEMLSEIIENLQER